MRCVELFWRYMHLRCAIKGMFMAFNLLASPWLEVRRASGVRTVIRPCDLTSRFNDDPILALDFPRPDWNAALTEFLIGLCALALAVEDAAAWAGYFIEPPAPERLTDGLARFAFAFAFDGEGPCAYQDFDTLAEQELKPVSGLLIDAPGENALRNNSDLFVRRGGVASLGLPYAAAALITLQTYAPSGGAGHRTSLRGGGPLTTLLSPRRRASKASTVATLWDRVWANVPEQSGDGPGPRPEDVFPWLSPTRTSVNGEVVTEENSHPILAFFACPRRIRLVFADTVHCDLSGESGRGASALRTQNYGANYLQWLHPLSPYRNDKKSGFLAIHPQAGPSDYGDWLAWWGGGGGRPAQPLPLWEERRRMVGHLLDEADGMEAFGFQMDNMKARQWLNASLPWIPLQAGAGGPLQEAVEQAISATDAAARALVRAAKIAFYGQRQGDVGGYRLPETLALNALREPGERLWRETEAEFRLLLSSLLARLAQGEAATGDLLAPWLSLLRRQTLRLFDDIVDLDGLTEAAPHRLLWARDKLSFEFANHPKAGVRKALGLAVTPKTRKGAA